MVECFYQKGTCPFGSDCKREHLEGPDDDPAFCKQITSAVNNISINIDNTKGLDENDIPMETPSYNNNKLVGIGNSPTTTPGTDIFGNSDEPNGNGCCVQMTSAANNITININNKKGLEDNKSNMCDDNSKSIITKEKLSDNNNKIVEIRNSTTTTPGNILTKSLTTTNTTFKALNNIKSDIYGNSEEPNENACCLQKTCAVNNVTININNKKGLDANKTNMHDANGRSIITKEKLSDNINKLFGIGNSTTTTPAGISFQQQQQQQKFTFEQTPTSVSFVFGGNSDSNINENQNGETSKWPDDHHISKQIDKSIMDFILVDIQPYNIVEGCAFKRLEFANPTEPNQYRKKTEQFFRSSLMPETFNKVQQKVVAILQSAKWISIAINITSSPDSLYSILSFTGYFLNESARKKVILGASVLDKDHKDLYIAEQLSKIVTNFKLEQKLHLVVCENAVNIEANMQLVNITALKCVAHNMQLVIYDAIFSDKHIQEVITKCRGIVKHFENSIEAKENLKIIQEKLSLDEFAIVLDMDSTWLSSYLMMERINEQRTAVEVYSKEHGGIEMLTTEECDLLNDIVETLESFYEAFIDLSQDNASVSLVIPLLDMLASTIEEDGAKFKDELKRSLKNRFKFIEISPFLIVATLLDTRFKNKYLNETQIEIAEKEMSDFINQSRTPAVIKTVQKSKNKLWEKHETLSSANISFKRELELYLQEPLTPRKSNIYEYWHKSSYENLKTIALKYISAPPTSIESEELFTAAGRLYTDGSDHLKGMEADKFLFCHYNIKLLDFVY